ncbi:hypothetical protein JMJ55_14035 [Belnapia sp. T6]|uniref:Uncharacterized protein n=1 Tax=Belnapia mucosa TaxID=2804532 RepID=A0ABS1V426_9PROT|nr:hypothetical protein [Belnapia mucosa]MBL6456450.1 hypothetical protein [Belnapia mucosa]
MQATLPQDLTLGPFAVDRDGSLRPREPGLRPAMRFAWRGRCCEAALGPEEVQLSAIAARIPSTAEAGPARPGAFAAIAALPGSLPPGWRARLLPDHRVQLETRAPLSDSPTTVELLAAMVRFALALDPYLERLDSACGPPSGTAKTWPG